MIGIYKLVFNGTDKVYIGKSESLERRFKEHQMHFRNGTHSIKMNEAYKQFGMPTFEILCECKASELASFEDETISIYNAVDNGFNTLYRSDDMPHSKLPGELNGMAKYSNRDILKAFSLLYSTKRTLLNISKRLGIQISTLSSISNGYRHTWLKDKYPVQYEQMINNRKLLTTNASKLYPPIMGPDGIVYNVTNVRQFCREHPLLGEIGYSHLNAVMTGKRKQHKGFKLCNPAEVILKEKRGILVDPDGIEYDNILNITEFCSKHPALAGNLNARKGLSRVFNKERDSYLGFRLKALQGEIN